MCRYRGHGCLYLIAALLLLPVNSQADTVEPATPVPRRLFSFIGGMGNAMGGGMGGEVEVYLFDDPLSLFEGLGHLFEDDDGGPGGPGNALGTRLFFGGVQDHVFLELSWNTLTFGYPRGTDLITGVNRRYGPAFQFGFQHAGLDGFSFMISGGVGYLPGSVPRYADRWPPRFTFGVGYAKR